MNTELLDTLLCPETEGSTVSNVPSSTSQSEATSSDSKEGTPTPTHSRKSMHSFNALLISKLIAIAHLSCKPGKCFQAVFPVAFCKNVFKIADLFNIVVI